MKFNIKEYERLNYEVIFIYIFQLLNFVSDPRKLQFKWEQLTIDKRAIKIGTDQNKNIIILKKKILFFEIYARHIFVYI